MILRLRCLKMQEVEISNDFHYRLWYVSYKKVIKCPLNKFIHIGNIIDVTYIKGLTWLHLITNLAIYRRCDNKWNENKLAVQLWNILFFGGWLQFTFSYTWCECFLACGSIHSMKWYRGSDRVFVYSPYTDFKNAEAFLVGRYVWGLRGCLMCSFASEYKHVIRRFFMSVIINTI